MPRASMVLVLDLFGDMDGGGKEAGQVLAHVLVFLALNADQLAQDDELGDVLLAQDHANIHTILLRPGWARRWSESLTLPHFTSSARRDR